MNCVETIGNNFKLLLKLKFLGFKSLILFLMTCSYIIFFEVLLTTTRCTVEVVVQLHSV